jgi:hypothetical protein
MGQFIGRPIANRPQDAILPYISRFGAAADGRRKIDATRKEY